MTKSEFLLDLQEKEFIADELGMWDMNKTRNNEINKFLSKFKLAFGSFLEAEKKYLEAK